jgi:hypothetical protein
MNGGDSLDASSITSRGIRRELGVFRHNVDRGDDANEKSRSMRFLFQCVKSIVLSYESWG